MPILIDCDPGVDDAIAILLALASPELEVLAITCVAGNVPVATAARNARMVVEAAGRRDLPVFAGAARPLLQPLETAEMVHGKSGLGDADPGQPLVNWQPGAVGEMIRLLQAPPEPVTVALLGPQTNLAIALTLAPEIAGNIRQVLVMGGAFEIGGNSSPVAEFNILTDPHAAQIVLKSDLAVRYAALDVTHQALMLPERIAAIAALPGRSAALAANWMRFYSRFDERKYGMPGGPLHDPVPLATLIAPDLLTSQTGKIAISLADGPAFAKTVFDAEDQSARHARFTGLEAEGMFALLAERLATLP